MSKFQVIKWIGFSSHCHHQLGYPTESSWQIPVALVMEVYTLPWCPLFLEGIDKGGDSTYLEVLVRGKLMTLF